MSGKPLPVPPHEAVSAPKGRLGSIVHPALVLALLAGEALLLGLRFDAAALASSESSIIRAVATVLGGASAFAVTLAAASLLLGSKRWSEELAALRTAGRPRAFVLRLSAQVASFALLYHASTRLFDGVVMVGAVEIAAWLSALTATLGCWLVLWAPWPVLRHLAWRLAGLAAGSLVLGALAYAGGRLSRQLWEPLRAWTFALVAPITRLLIPTADIDTQACVIVANDFAVEIAAACSGYEGLGLTLVFLSAFFWLFRDRLRFPRVFLLVVPILVTVWLLNAVRIATLVAIGAYLSPELALGSFHSYIGSLLFAGVNLAIMFAVLRVPIFLRGRTPTTVIRHGPTVNEPGENIAASYLVPFLCLVAVALLSLTFSTEGTSTWYPLRVIVATGALWVYRRPVRRFLRRDSAGVDSAVGAPVHVGLWLAAVVIAATAAWLLANGLDGSGGGDDVVPAFARTAAGRFAAIAWWVFRIAGTIAIVPLAEELAFRGFVIRRLTSPDVERVRWADITPFAVVAQAVLFGVLHPQHMLGGIFAGLAFGWLGRHTRRGYAPVLAHAATNALVLVLAASTGRWDWL